MQFNMGEMAPAIRYELLLGTVVPRPIALVTSWSEAGEVNAAPYSLFNVMGHEPPIVMISVLPHADRKLKDTANNILATREFVVSLVNESIAEAMNITCIDAPAGLDELKLASLNTVASSIVKPPRVAESLVALECKLLTSLAFGPNQAIIVGEIVSAFVADEFVTDAARGLVATENLKLIGAMHGARWYARLSDRFAMDRPTWAQWSKERGER